MQTVVLAAGEGTRMRPLTETVPKPMLPVADRPLAAHTADAAVDAGATELILVVGYEADAVREYFGGSYRDVPISYAVQKEQLGTAHAVGAAREHLDGPFVVLNGDNLYDPGGIESLFESAPAVAGHRVADPRNYGVLSTDGGRVTAVVEKPDDPPSHLANAGAYAFPAEAVEWLDVGRSERGEFEITDVLARAVDAFDVAAVELDRWMDVGRPWELLEANEWKLSELGRRIEGEIHESAEIRGPVIVEDGAVVEAGVVVEGPALVRSGADLGPNSYVRGATLLGEDAHVGHAVEVKNSVLMSGATVPHLSYVGDSLLGPDVNLGAGTQVANLRHDGEPVRTTVKGERISTDRRKYGVVAGPNVKTGVNTSLDPGVVLSANATTLPGERVDRDR
jgi:bifunctional UDP-N-acetylglucosamine pyrophosphorylase/glucosamine-1-phosphate N-acetyltransferase